MTITRKISGRLTLLTISISLLARPRFAPKPGELLWIPSALATCQTRNILQRVHGSHFSRRFFYSCLNFSLHVFVSRQLRDSNVFLVVPGDPNCVPACNFVMKSAGRANDQSLQQRPWKNVCSRRRSRAPQGIISRIESLLLSCKISYALERGWKFLFLLFVYPLSGQDFWAWGWMWTDDQICITSISGSWMCRPWLQFSSPMVSNLEFCNVGNFLVSNVGISNLTKKFRLLDCLWRSWNTLLEFFSLIAISFQCS